MTLLTTIMLLFVSAGLRGDEVETDEAIAVLESPGSVDLLYARGIAHLRKRDWNSAVADFTQVIKLQPDHVSARYHRATAYQNLGRNDEAIADLDEALSQGKPPRSATRTKQPPADLVTKPKPSPDMEIILRDTATKEQGDVIGETAGPSNAGNTSALLGRAKASYQAGAFGQAIVDYSAVLQLDPNSIEAYLGRAWAYRESKDFPHAIEDFHSALQRNGNLADAYEGRGVCYAELGELDKALADFNEALRLDPENYLAYYDRGLIYMKRNQTLQAIEAFDQAIKRNPKYPYAYQYRGMMYYGLGAFEKALKDFTKAVRLAPNLEESRTMRSRTMDRLRERSIVAQEAPDLPQLDYARDCHDWAVHYYRGGFYAEAIKECRRALDMEPDFLPAKNTLAWLYACCPWQILRDAERALELADDVCEHTEWKDAAALDTLAAAYASAGDFQAAIRYEEQALQWANDSQLNIFNIRLSNYRLGIPWRDSYPRP